MRSTSRSRLASLALLAGFPLASLIGCGSSTPSAAQPESAPSASAVALSPPPEQAAVQAAVQNDEPASAPAPPKDEPAPAADPKPPPRVASGPTGPSGRLAPEVIQGVVRRNFGAFRHCYDEGLKRKPDLQGRVAARFTINRDGTVSDVSDMGSDLADSGVVKCALKIIAGLKFPVPDGGFVTVIYPLKFSPGDEGEPASPSPSPSPSGKAPSPPKPAK